jgi:hypothetical protein
MDHGVSSSEDERASTIRPVIRSMLPRRSFSRGAGRPSHGLIPLLQKPARDDVGLDLGGAFENA